jgi:hypothetical protein
MREALGKSNRRKRLIENPRFVLEDNYIYVEKLILTIRSSIVAFNAIVKNCPANQPNLDFLVESFAFSFFEDLMNPENSEIELLKVINRMIDLEFTRTKHITHIFNENAASILSKMLLLYTKRRTQRKYLKLLFKKPINKILNTHTIDLKLDPKQIYNSFNI